MRDGHGTGRGGGRRRAATAASVGERMRTWYAMWSGRVCSGVRQARYGLWSGQGRAGSQSGGTARFRAGSRSIESPSLAQLIVGTHTLQIA
jgi:hypothetical protein